MSTYNFQFLNNRLTTLEPCSKLMIVLTIYVFATYFVYLCFVRFIDLYLSQETSHEICEDKSENELNWPYGKQQKESPVPVPLSDRMKYYEVLSKNIVKVDERLPFAMRLDGRAFSKFTKFLKYYGKKYYSVPYSPEFKRAMILTTHDLVHEFSASSGYTHSDEITLVFSPCTTDRSTHQFDGKVSKLLTTISSFATARFIFYLDGEMNNLKTNLGEKLKPDKYDPIEYLCTSASTSSTPTFDARLIVFPLNKIYEFGNLLLWRSRYDCSRNFVSMFAEEYVGKKKLIGLNTEKRVDELIKAGIVGFTKDDENIDYSLKCGVFMKRSERESFTTRGNSLSTNFYVFKTLKYSEEFVSFLLESKDYDKLIESSEMKQTNPQKYTMQNIKILLYHIPDYRKKASECENIVNLIGTFNVPRIVTHNN